MRTAYENWLVSQVQNIPDEDRKIILAILLYYQCSKGHKMTFDIVARVQERDWTNETFEKAAETLLKPEES